MKKVTIFVLTLVSLSQLCFAKKNDEKAQNYRCFTKTGISNWGHLKTLQNNADPYHVILARSARPLKDDEGNIYHSQGQISGFYLVTSGGIYDLFYSIKNREENPATKRRKKTTQEQLFELSEKQTITIKVGDEVFEGNLEQTNFLDNWDDMKRSENEEYVLYAKPSSLKPYESGQEVDMIAKKINPDKSLKNAIEEIKTESLRTFLSHSELILNALTQEKNSKKPSDTRAEALSIEIEKIKNQKTLVKKYCDK